MTPEEFKQLNSEAIQLWGKHQRIDKTIEELIEFTHVLVKLKKLPENCFDKSSDTFLEFYPQFMSELADVIIVCNVMADTFGITDLEVDKFVDEKLAKFDRAVSKANGHEV